MGTPEDNERVVRPLTFAEKLELLKFGEEIGQSLATERLAEVLERARIVIQPLVEWLDKPIYRGYMTRVPLPQKFRKRRGLHLWGLRGGVIIWLERSGKWALWQDEPVLEFSEVNSRELALAIASRAKDFSQLFRIVEKKHELLWEQMASFFGEAATYYVLVVLLVSEFGENINKQLEEREKREKLMRQRLDSLREFTTALDPVAARERKVKVPAFSIFHENERGSSRSSGDYLCPEALVPFHKIIKERDKPSQYKELDGSYTPNSLSGLLDRMRYIVDDIVKAEQHDLRDAKSLFGCNYGRLPLSEEELVVLQKIAEQIKGK